MKRLTIRDIQKMKTNSQPITMLTAYDATSAGIAEQADIPMILVGDTLGMVVQGHDSTIPVKLEHMIYHAEIVTRVTNKPFVVGDLPFMTYSVSPEQALENSGKLMQQAGVSAVKLEGGETMAPTIKRITEAGIPVMAHIGLIPQSVNQFGGFRVQGKQIESARQLIRDALAVQEAGAFAVVLELVPSTLSTLITEKLTIPTIGIGAGVGCDGQVQVFHDILALFNDFVPKHTKQYTNVHDIMMRAVQQYHTEVIDRDFPTDDNGFTMSDDVIATLRDEVLNARD
ncbi:MAG: 3-methyl-2-oxobutanoate hydroxymethyltransferase [Phototrophicaceae bacterium]